MSRKHLPKGPNLNLFFQTILFYVAAKVKPKKFNYVIQTNWITLTPSGSSVIKVLHKFYCHRCQPKTVKI